MPCALSVSREAIFVLCDSVFHPRQMVRVDYFCSVRCGEVCQVLSRQLLKKENGVIEASDITVSVPCLFANEDPIWMMRVTADRFGYKLRPYGIGETYKGWHDIKILKLREEALSCPTSHILYTDARDAWFLAGPEEIAKNYNDLGCPPLMLSAQCDIFGTYAKWYEGLPWDMSKEFRYIGTPGQLCEAKALAEALGWMQANYHLGEPDDPQGLPDDDPSFWLEFMRAFPDMLQLDHECSIFMNAGSELDNDRKMWTDCLEFQGNRVYNKITRTYPCVLHFNGGYSHALHGKWDRLEPYWRKCGYTENPPWGVDARTS